MDVRENVRRAIDVMTAWTAETGYEFAWSRLVENLTDDPDGDIMLLMGFVNLAGELAMKLERTTGREMRCHLQDIALKYG